MKERKKPEKFWLPHGMPSDDREFAFSSRVFPKASQIKALYKLWHYQVIRAGCMWASAVTRPRSPAIACGYFGTVMDDVCTQTPQRSCSCAMAVGVTVVTS